MIMNEWDIRFFTKAELFPQASVRMVFSLKDRLVRVTSVTLVTLNKINV